MIFYIKKILINDIGNTVVLRLFSAMFSFLITLLIARHLQPALRGEFVYIISVSSLFVLGYFTIQHSIVSLHKKYSNDNLISNSLFLFFILTIVNEIIMYFIISKNINSPFQIFLYFLFPLVYFQVLSNTYYQIFNKLIYFNVINLIYKVILFILVFFSLYFFQNLWYTLGSFVIINLIFSIHLIFDILKNIKFKFDLNILLKIIKSSFIIHLTTISAIILGEYNNYYIGNNLNFKELAFYDVATQISGIFVLVGSSLVPIIFNRGIHLSTNEFGVFFKKAIIIVLSMLFLFIVFVINFSDYLIIFTFGEKYLNAKEILEYNMLLVFLQILSILLFPLWILNNNLKIFSFISIINAIIYFSLLHVVSINSSIEVIRILICSNIILLVCHIIYAYKILKD